MAGLLSRREFMKRGVALGAFAAGFGGLAFARKAGDLYEQHSAWAEASRPNSEFFARHAAELARLRLGGSFAPEQWPADAAGQRRALDGLDLAVGELGMRHLRLGLRWSRLATGSDVDLSPYRPLIDASFEKGADLCLNIGPVRVFRWPEEHVPPGVELPAHGTTVGLGSPLADAALAYTERLLAALHREYGAAPENLGFVQIENEPYFALGPHRWRMSEDYLVKVAKLVDDAMPRAGLMVTSAGRLNLDEVRRLFARLVRERPALAGRLVSGFDFHYKTPLRDSFPVIRHFDQVAYATPFAETLARNVWDARDLGFGIEVSEAQAEPYGQFQSPGNSARDFRFLILRCLREVLDPQAPGLVRLWGLERLVQRMRSGELTEEHRGIIEIIQSVNRTGQPRVTR
jgi:hypothetical protein